MNALWSGQDLIVAALVALAVLHLAWRAWRTFFLRSSLTNTGCGGGCQGCSATGVAGTQLVTLTLASNPRAQREETRRLNSKE